MVRHTICAMAEREIIDRNDFLFEYHSSLQYIEWKLCQCVDKGLLYHSHLAIVARIPNTVRRDIAVRETDCLQCNQSVQYCLIVYFLCLMG